MIMKQDLQDLMEENHEQNENGETGRTAETLAAVDVSKLTDAELDRFEAELAALPRETVAASMELCYRMVLLRLQRWDQQGARRWQNALIALRKGMTEGTPAHKQLENRIFCAGIALAQNPSSNLLLNLSVLKHEFGGEKITLARLSATNKMPSVLRGAKDLSFLSPYYSASASIVRPLLDALLEDGGSGVCEVGIAEVLYQKNDINGASLQVAGGFSVNNPEIVFAGLAQLAWIGAVDPNAKPPEKVLEHFAALLEERKADYLRPNFEALAVRFAMLRGHTEKIRAWVDACPADELSGCIPANYYILITKAKAYLALGEYRSAATLLESLILALQENDRILDLMECLAGSAVACELLGSGEVAVKKLERALMMAQEYGYVRVFADYGKQMFHLLTRYTREGQLHEELQERFLKRIIEAAKTYSTLWPALFDAGTDAGAEEQTGEELTQSEVHILQLLDTGRTNKQIADELDVKVTTVKFHLSNIMEKLGAANRVEAIKRAREKGILA